AKDARVLMRGCLLVCFACLGIAAPAPQESSSSSPTVAFLKEFPGSVPPYYSVAVQESGEAVYRTDPADEAPIEFRLPAEVAGEIFSLARKLGPLRGATLESKRRVANMGRKTLEYRSGDEHSTASFNHTEVPEALALVGLFERISQTQQHAIRLQYLIQFDRLGIVKALLQLEMDLDNGRLVAPSLLVPILEQIVRDRAVVQLAKGRATQILGKIQATTPPPPSSGQTN
ncbi:MAG: hypothetical protein ACRD88_01575, partial [Terriglobia bacterium]